MKKKTLLILLVFGGLGLVFLIGVLSAIALPNFLTYRVKSKQSEAQYMLKVLLTKEQEFRRANGHWATTPRELVEYVNSPPRSSSCFLGPESGWGGKKPVEFKQLPPSVRARLSENVAAVEAQKNKTNIDAELVIACAVNLDEDEALEVWTISASEPTPRLDSADLNR